MNDDNLPSNSKGSKQGNMQVRLASLGRNGEPISRQEVADQALWSRCRIFLRDAFERKVPLEDALLFVEGMWNAEVQAIDKELELKDPWHTGTLPEILIVDLRSDWDRWKSCEGA